jgi:hypothetical protein
MLRQIPRSSPGLKEKKRGNLEKAAKDQKKAKRYTGSQGSEKQTVKIAGVAA